MVDIGKVILSSVYSSIANVIIGIIFTLILVEFNMESLIPSIWALLIVGIPLQVIIILKLIDSSR